MFEVVVKAEAPYYAVDGVSLGRVSIDKTFRGDLEGSSHVEMLAAGTPVQGSAGYVAIEHVKGSLLGRVGGFVLQHSGTMVRGRPALSVSVVPDSGTGELVGLSGTMSIEISDAKHSYIFEHSLALDPRPSTP